MMNIRTATEWNSCLQANFSRLTRLMALGLLCLLSLSQGTWAQSGQPNDEGYSKKIREFTTEPFFITNLVDHLPASPAVPTPEKILGHIIGAPGYLTYTKDI
jgi:hypothetical protein